MSDTGVVFRAMKEESKERRASHREKSPALLFAAGIPFEKKNGGAHLIVEGCECFVDFWPGTGKWISRNGNRGFGVRKLIEYVKSSKVPRSIEREHVEANFINAAVKAHTSDDLEIELVSPVVSVGGDSGAWIQAWVWVPDYEAEDEE